MVLPPSAAGIDPGVVHPSPDVRDRQIGLLSSLRRISALSSSGPALSELLASVAELTVETLGVDACTVFLYDAATATLALRAAVGFNPDAVGALTLRPGTGIVGHAAEMLETVVADDAQAHPAFHQVPDVADHLYRSQISVPMLASRDDALVGVLTVSSRARRDFLIDLVVSVEAFARETANAIAASRERSENDERLRRKVNELGTLQRVSHMMASSLDLSEVLRSIAEASVELIDAEAAALFRLTPSEQGGDDANAFILDYGVGDMLPLVDEAKRTQLILQVIRTGGARITAMDYVGGSNPLFCLPLRSGRETLGALCIRLRPGVELTEDELGLLQAFTDAATLAIENARLYEGVKKSAALSSTLLQEMHHRVRNNLQTVAALLSLQIRQDPNSGASTILREAASRIQSIAAVHDLLSDEGRFAGATVDVIARLVVDEIRSTIVPPDFTVAFEIEPSECLVSSRQATIIALLVNELIANAIEHGFRRRKRGTIVIRGRSRGRFCAVEVENDGETLPAGFDLVESSGLGMRIVERLVSSDLQGRFGLTSKHDRTVARVTFPLVVDPLRVAGRPGQLIGVESPA